MVKLSTYKTAGKLQLVQNVTSTIAWDFQWLDKMIHILHQLHWVHFFKKGPNLKCWHWPFSHKWSRAWLMVTLGSIDVPVDLSRFFILAQKPHTWYISSIVGRCWSTDSPHDQACSCIYKKTLFLKKSQHLYWSISHRGSKSLHYVSCKANGS